MLLSTEIKRKWEILLLCAIVLKYCDTEIKFANIVKYIYVW